MVVLLDPFVLLKDVGVVLGVNDLLLVFLLLDLFSSELRSSHPAVTTLMNRVTGPTGY